MLSEKEFNLSEKIEGQMKTIGKSVPLRDIQEFIRRLKEWENDERKNNNIFRKSADELNEAWMEKIDKLAGNKLNGN